MMERVLLAAKVDLGAGQIEGLSPIGKEALKSGSAQGVVAAFTTQLSNIIAFLTILGSLFFVIYFIVGGFEWLQAGGDTGKAEKARTRMINAAIGLLVMILATALVGIIGGVFGIDILNPADTFLQIIPKVVTP